MAGYMRELNGYVYDGANKAGEALTNGVFASITSTGVKKITEAGDTEFRVEEKTTLFGKPAVVLNCVVEGAKEHYFVENDFDTVDGGADYDEANNVIPVGTYVRMHRPVINDQLIMTVTAEVAATLAVGDIAKPASGGSIAKKTT